MYRIKFKLPDDQIWRCWPIEYTAKKGAARAARHMSRAGYDCYVVEITITETSVKVIWAGRHPKAA